MYTIQTMECTGPTNMNHIPAPHPREPVATEFYRHPYGGIARDIYVTREGFARFFEMTPEQVDRLEPNMKVIDYEWMYREVLGYKLEGCLANFGQTQYRITIIDKTHGGLMRHWFRTGQRLGDAFKQAGIGIEKAAHALRDPLSHSTN